MIHIRSLLICILIPNLVGILGNMLGNSAMGFESLVKPSFTPPSIVFPITWFILYTLMGISSYLICTSNHHNSKNSIKIYALQLFLNLVWPFFFFGMNWFFFSFLWIIFIILVVILMICSFAKINKTAALLQIPYVIWLIFAAILNFNILLLN